MKHTDKIAREDSQSMENRAYGRSAAAARLPTNSDIDSSPRIQAQRKAIAAMFGPAARVPMQEADAGATVQRAVAESHSDGLPNQLKTGIESLSGMSVDHVKVNYNSDMPAQLDAHAYAQGNNIHISPGQEKHLPHEAWHVVQQMQGRVRPTLQTRGAVAVNDESGLESEADVMGENALRMGESLLPKTAHAGISAAAPSLSAGIRVGTVAQRVAKRSTPEHADLLREATFKLGWVNKPGLEVLRRIGATNIVEAGMAHVVTLLREALTPVELEAVFAGVLQANLAGMFAHAPPSLALYRSLAAKPPGVIEDFFALPHPAAPTVVQIAKWYGNYLQLPGHPIVYNANDYIAFSATMMGPPRQYRDFVAAAWAPMNAAYYSYVRFNAGANLRIDGFATNVYDNGLRPDLGTGVPAATAGWNHNANQTATHTELTLTNQGLRPVTAEYTPQMNRAIDIAQQNAPAVTALAGANHDGRMRTVLSILSQHPHANTLAALQQYVNVFGQGVINNEARLSPFRLPTWEAAFAHPLANDPNGPAVVVWIGGNADARLPALRTTFAQINPGAAPNFAPLWGLIGTVIAQNQPQLAQLFAHLPEIQLAQPLQNAVGLAFSNRAGGLRGHFKKHVLGQANIDAGEPAAWMADLNLVGQITRAHLGALSSAEEQVIFQRWFPGVRSAIAPGTALDQTQINRLIFQVQTGAMGPTADAVAVHHENAYAARVGHAYDNAAGSYLMYDVMPKVIAWFGAGARGIYTISGLVAGAGAFDLSSGYMPSNTAQVKFNGGYAQRFWDT